VAFVKSSTISGVLVASTDCNETPPENYIYMNSLAWLAGWVKQRASESEFSEDEIEAQIAVDLRRLLDQNWKEH